MSVLSNRFSDAGKEAGDYTRAVLGLLGDRDPIAVLEQTPAELTRIVTRLMKEDLARPEKQGKWSMQQVMRHLGDSEVVWGYRLRRVIAEDRPAIEGYDQDRWADRLSYDRADAVASAATRGEINGGADHRFECFQAVRAYGGDGDHPQHLWDGASPPPLISESWAQRRCALSLSKGGSALDKLS